jgi:predicted nucleotidyltransferase
MVNPRDIKQAALKIAEQFRPERIVLFGSYAYGKPTEDSDVDLLVLVRGGKRIHNRAIAIRLAFDFPFPLDLLVRSTEEFEHRITLGDYFLREIKQKGKVLYDATDSRVGQKGGRGLRDRTARNARQKISQLR